MWCRVTRARYMECEKSDFNLNMYAYLICVDFIALFAACCVLQEFTNAIARAVAILFV